MSEHLAASRDLTGSGEPVLLDATLRPNPPMRPKSLLIILAVVTILNLGFAAYFIAHGAWPIMPFMGADIALLAWAFRASSRAARRFERVTLTPARLRVASHPVKGTATETEFNPYWVRVDMSEPLGRGANLFLRSHGKVLELGRFLAPGERASFAETLRAALNRAQNFR